MKCYALKQRKTSESFNWLNKSPVLTQSSVVNARFFEINTKFSLSLQSLVDQVDISSMVFKTYFHLFQSC